MRLSCAMSWSTQAIFQTTIDSEVIAYHIARARIHTHNVESAVAAAMKKLKGAYSLVIMSPRKLIRARDPMGFKPLCIGKRDNAYTSWHQRHVPWRPLGLSLSGMWSRGKS